jgi:hypothetical protein
MNAFRYSGRVQAEGVKYIPEEEFVVGVEGGKITTETSQGKKLL